MYKRETLPNGLRIICNPMQGMQSVALGIWIHVGGRYEPAQFKGISHFLEHLLFKGSRKHSCRKIKESIEGVGGSLNGFTSEEVTCYFVKIPSFHLSLALGVLSDMVLNPLLAQEEITKERTVILEEIKMYKDLPQSYVHDLLDELLWPGHPLGMSVIGTDESVGRVNRANMRAYQKTYYVPFNIVVSACGKLQYETFIREVRDIFPADGPRTIPAFLKAREKQSGPQVKVFAKETEQTHLALGFHGFRRDHPQRHALALLHIILGANMSSRLFNEVREKRGLAYEIGTQVKRFHDTGAFLVHAGIDNDKVTPAIRLILKELVRIRAGLVSEGEFRRAKEFYLGQLMLALEDTLDHMLWIGESSATMDKVYTLEEIIKAVRTVSRSDVRDVARRIFKEDSLNLALIGPLKEKENAIRSQLHL